MSNTLKKPLKIYKQQLVYYEKLNLSHTNYRLLDNDYLLEERLEERILMKKLKETNIDSPVGVTDVVEIMLDKPIDDLTDDELKELVKPKKPKGRPKKEENFEWVYKLLERHGNVFVNEKTYKKLDEKRLGNYSIDFLKKTTIDEQDGYVIWKI